MRLGFNLGRRLDLDLDLDVRRRRVRHLEGRDGLVVGQFKRRPVTGFHQASSSIHARGARERADSTLAGQNPRSKPYRFNRRGLFAISNRAWYLR